MHGSNLPQSWQLKELAELTKILCVQDLKSSQDNEFSKRDPVPCWLSNYFVGDMKTALFNTREGKHYILEVAQLTSYLHPQALFLGPYLEGFHFFLGNLVSHRLKTLPVQQTIFPFPESVERQ